MMSFSGYTLKHIGSSIFLRRKKYIVDLGKI